MKWCAWVARLFGEIIEIRGGDCSIQVYEETEGIGPGQPVFRTGEALSVELGPGLIRSIYDGVQRPLDKLSAAFGDYIVRGAESPALDRLVQWDFLPVAKEGDAVAEGDVLGTVRESKLVVHKIMTPRGGAGTVSKIAPVTGNVDTVVAVIDTANGPREVTMVQRWPVREPRPVARKMPPKETMTTGQRVLDMLFPLAMGGTACVPGPFGSGKTVVQHQLAKWANASIVVYVGCGERGNEMTDVLMEFPELKDPTRASRSWTDRAYREHLQHTRRRPRSVGVHRHYHCGVLPGYGLFGRPDGGFDQPLGGSHARNVRTPQKCRARKGTRLPGRASPVSTSAAAVSCARVRTAARDPLHHRGRIAARR